MSENIYSENVYNIEINQNIFGMQAIHFQIK